MTQWAEKTAVITGAASGIGLALAKRAAREGMRLVLADIASTGLESAAKGLGIGADRIATAVTDVSLAADVDRLADLAFNRFGAVHLLCNNAGVARSGLAWEYSDADWQWVLGVDLWSVIHGVSAFVPRMLAQDDAGHVVNTASAAGLVSTPGMAAYNVAKHGVVTLSETLRADLASVSDKVKASVLCPAWVPTRIFESERNRPERFGAAAPISAPAAAADAGAAKAVKSGRLSADDIADEVFAAVANGDFWIIPHKKMGLSIRARADEILAACNPHGDSTP